MDSYLSGVIYSLSVVRQKKSMIKRVNPFHFVYLSNLEIAQRAAYIASAIVDTHVFVINILFVGTDYILLLLLAKEHYCYCCIFLPT